MLNNFPRVLCSGVLLILRSKNYKGLALKANPFRFAVLIFQPRILGVTLCRDEFNLHFRYCCLGNLFQRLGVKPSYSPLSIRETAR